MADPLEVRRIDRLPGGPTRDEVAPLRHSAERHPQKRRPPQPRRPAPSDPEEPPQVGTRLNVRA